MKNPKLLMNTTDVLIPLHEIFSEAGCVCSIVKDQQATTLYIGYQTGIELETSLKLNQN